MTIIEKEYKASEINFDNLQKYLKGNKDAKYIERSCVELSVFSDIYHYLSCTIVLTEIPSLKDNKIDEIWLKVISDTDAQSKKVFDELENILLSEIKNKQNEN